MKQQFSLDFSYQTQKPNLYSCCFVFFFCVSLLNDINDNSYSLYIPGIVHLIGCLPIIEWSFNNKPTSRVLIYSDCFFE